MRVLVAFASRHGATRQIAERIAATLFAAGLDAVALQAQDARDPASHDAFVVGSAVYMFHWPKEMAGFVETIQPRGQVMFYGACSPGSPVGLGERFVAMMPAARDAMPVGDFRDWEALEAWAASIAADVV